MKKKVLLFHPSNYYGGASVLFYRIFVHLQSINTDVYYFDRNDGFTTSLSNNKDRIIYDVEKLPFDVNSEYVVICTTTNFSKARKAFLGVSEQPTYKVWSVHPYEFGPNFYYLGRRLIDRFGVDLCKKYMQLRKRKFEKIKNKFKNRKGNLFFMDGATEQASSYILEQSKNGCDGEYLQIPANILHSQKEVALIRLKERLKNKCDKNYNFAYLGRVEDFKYPPLKSLLIELDLILDYKVTFTIVGGGRNLNNILELELNNIVLVSKNKLNLEESTRFLSNNIDLLFAMGTSALDGAALGIPVVLLNPSNRYSNDTRYRWLYETENYTLGDYSDAPWYVDKGHTLKHIIDLFERELQELSVLSLDYVFDNHSIDIVCNKLIKKVMTDDSSFHEK